MKRISNEADCRKENKNKDGRCYIYRYILKYLFYEFFHILSLYHSPEW